MSLSEAEEAEALRLARRAKYVRIKTEELRRKISEPQTYPKLDKNQIAAFAEKKGFDLMGKFHLDEHRKKIFDLLCLYFSGDPDFEKEGFSLKKGIFLQGHVGVGKTKMMEIFKVNSVASFSIIGCSFISDLVMSDGVEVIPRYYNHLSGMRNELGHNEFDICFDDLGTESKVKYFGNDVYVMEKILQARYQNQQLTHITTNLTGVQIQEMYGERIRSRLREMCNVIAFDSKANDLR